MRYRRRYNPLSDLIHKIRVAAAQIEIAPARRIAAREADHIPLTQLERAHGKRGEMAKRARQVMRSLPSADPSQYPALAQELRDCVAAIDSRFEVTSEIELGRKPRSQPGATA